ncbi:hypothetical protein [Streptococcus uberis]|uniref:hypothetical protein n=1 Tax=Streptococcus uberis TaxID=1349 RepID=UPI001FF64DD8|nr:hypothetical protein [Streptococcus uberis]MCK1219591.1 hypothetical protein [Streptococcus uberis]
MGNNCSVCGNEIINKIKSAIYCSEECRKIGKNETQKILMREKRKKEKEQKIEELKKSQANKIEKFKPKKIRDIKKYYQKKKQELLENEKQFGYVGRILIEGIDIHDPDFEKLIMEKIK